ncbi:DUF883 family protein [Polynucleobacter brandtiae]|uniref:ElaB/YqjD/DUF883 family membrane-anchored ribosome-binding protein n=1 Tax=Polynucleobacter brandtiae TaxID=1938816 RepID=A0A2M8VXY0_9BURK|nr:DUF883 family protein [Polynucleobacter brandtiae]PJI82713.1 ElaB/YqjD/DUF883 family membrane-anchored ribosome-binding protein [Polynucleobacter brandtiae]
MTTKKAALESHKDIDQSSEHLVDDFKALMADAEALIKATAQHEEGPLNAIRARAIETLSSAKQNLATLEDGLMDKAKVAAEGADDFVHHKPWQAVGIAAGVGVLIGLLMSRR